ncbi:4440_t:CDS:2 [Entrophospora sp. SA101]|nr:13318_t:CDS:2 [Entrophospora sp. SA101]CAJ0846309.1 4440_t:CDS:2 [Entrophospora sp. SA101]
MQYFAQITQGHAILMGRKTFESIGKPLSKRHNIILTKNQEWAKKMKLKHPQLVIENNLSLTIQQFTNKPERLFIIGGKEIFYQTYSFADQLFISLIKKKYPGNIKLDFFPTIIKDFQLKEQKEFPQFVLTRKTKSEITIKKVQSRVSQAERKEIRTEICFANLKPEKSQSGVNKEKVGQFAAQIRKLRRHQGGELDLSEYVGLEKICVSEYLRSSLTKLTLGNHPNLTELNCSRNQLPSLDVLGCPNLTELYCYNNQLTSIDLSKCPNLTELYCPGNQLTSIDFLKQLPQPEKLIRLGLANNNIEPTNLEFLRPFINLTFKLALGNDSPKNNILNRFYGSLEPLRDMTKLKGLCIDGTDVEEGLEYLPTSIERPSKALNYIIQNEPNKEAKIVRLETQIKILKEIVEQEREIHQDSMKAMDNFYQNNPPQENTRLKNILKVFEKDYLKLNRERQVYQQENKELKQSLEVVNKIAEQENQPKETKDQATQTDITNQDFEQLAQQQTIQTKDQQIKELKQKLTQLENQQQQTEPRTEIGTSKTKSRGEVKGSTRKIYRQKGTGGARHGQRSQVPGRGIAHGPTGKENYHCQVNKKVRKKALQSALSKKNEKGEIMVIDKISFSEYKTKEANKLLTQLKLNEKKVLIIFSMQESKNEEVKRAFRNLPKVAMTSSKLVNTYSMITHSILLFTQESFNETEKRLKNNHD